MSYGLLYLPTLKALTSSIDEIEHVRIATGNRLYQLTNTDVDKDDGERGLGLAEDHPDVIVIKVLLDGLKELEDGLIKRTQKEMRQSFWGPWIKDAKGVGEKQLARLLGEIGDPYWNTLYDRPRTVSELWAYCGFHVVDGSAPRRKRGVQANWSESARSKTRLIAESCLKSPGGKYEQEYRRVKEHYEDAIHEQDCVRCGPSGKPALKDTEISKGHKHARALRNVGKLVLKDLWIEAKRLHEEINT